MRQIVLDTETTGLEVKEGHRIIEIGCVELIDRRLTGNDFHQYINPEREIGAGAFAIHGIDSKFLSDKPVFGDVASKFVEYVKGSELIIHNAKFDVGFLNAELLSVNKALQKLDACCNIIDTLALARKLHPGQRNNLDALCKRYMVDNSGREVHGALLDATLLAHVYLAMTGGQTSLFGSDEHVTKQQSTTVNKKSLSDVSLPVVTAEQDELKSHEELLAKIKEGNDGVCVWEEE